MTAERPGHATPIVFELCAETLEAVAAAAAGGAQRVELCTALDVGGLTPSTDLVKRAIARTPLPVHILLRPTAATFQYSPEIFAALRHSLLLLRDKGVAGFVLGILTSHGHIDVEHTRALVELASPLPVTFHRAFDEITDLLQALEDVIATGCTRLLTSGGRPDVLSGAHVLARLVRQAGPRIDIAVGGGLRLANASIVAELTGASHFHASLREDESAGDQPGYSLVQRLRRMVDTLYTADSSAQRSSATESSAAESHTASSPPYTTAGTGTELSGSRSGR